RIRVDGDVGMQDGIAADPDPVPDDRVRSNRRARPEDGRGGDDGRRMDARWRPARRMEQLERVRAGGVGGRNPPHPGGRAGGARGEEDRRRRGGPDERLVPAVGEKREPPGGRLLESRDSRDLDVLAAALEGCSERARELPQLHDLPLADASATVQPDRPAGTLALDGGAW